jgi:hypothetical protein
MNEFECDGMWWLPSHPDILLPGILTYEPVNGAKLKILGADAFGLADILGIDRKAWKPTYIELFCGNTSKGAATLYNCTLSQMQVADTFRSVTYSPGLVFLGCHLTSKEERLFESISVQFTNLEEWVNIGEWVQTFTDDEKLIQTTRSYSHPKSTIYKTSHCALEISFFLARDQVERFAVQEELRSSITITPSEPMDFYELNRKYIYQIQNLITLGLGTPVLPTAILATSQTIKTSLTKTSNSVQIFYALGHQTTLNTTFRPRQMRFRYTDIQDNFSQYLENWLSNADQLLPVHDLYFGLYYLPTLYGNLEFLMIAQALEVYHRQKYGGKYVSDEEFEKVRAALQDAIPQNLDKAFREKLLTSFNFLNEYSLRKRLKLILDDVLQPYKSDLDRMLFSDSSRDQFIQDFVNARNYFTHYSNGADNPSRLASLTRKARLLMQFCFMVELGFSTDLTSKLFRDKSPEWY